MPLEDDIAAIRHQEATLILPKFDTETAWQLGTTLRDLALSRGHVLIIDIRRFGNPHQQLFFSALPHTPPDLARWVERKVNVVARLHQSSYLVGLLLKQENRAFSERYGIPHSETDYTPHGGSFPLHVANAGIVGAVTLSGLPQREDHNLVVEALCLLTGHDFASLRLL